MRVNLLIVRRNGHMPNLVAFLDMLGTKESTRAGTFHRVDTLEFANAVGLAAMSNPEMQFAAFSDSVVVSAPAEVAERFVAVLAFLLGNWFCEFILARGGIALGEIEWVDQPSIDGHFRVLTNFRYARVYGGALVEAVELERASGPGAVCFLSQSAARHLAAVSPDYVLPGLTPMLVWADQRVAGFLTDFLKHMLLGEKSMARSRHVSATLSFIEQAADAGKFAPIGLVERMLGVETPPNKRIQATAHGTRRG